MDKPSHPADVIGFLQDRSELAFLIRQFDWTRTPLGPLDAWPQSLRSITAFLLRSPVPIVLLWGVDGIMIYNDAYSVFAGSRHPGLLGQKVREGWPEVADFNDHVMRTGLAGGTLNYQDQELQLNRHGRLERAWMNLDYSSVIDESGQPAGVIAIVVETTERVLADRRLAAEQKRQRQLFSQMPGFVCVLSGPEHVFEYANEAYMEVTGCRELIGRPVREVFPEMEQRNYFDLLDQVYATGQRIVTRGGEVRFTSALEPQFLDFAYEPIRDDDGVITGVFVGGYEVSDVHRASAALRASETRLRELNADLERQVIERSRERGRIWAVSPDLISVIDSEGRFESVNPAWTSLLGWTTSEVGGTPYLEFLHPDDLSASREMFRQVRRGEPVLGFENRFRHREGHWCWLSWVAVPVDEKIYCSARDVSREKAATAELALAQEALRQSQKMEAVGQLTGGIAHDFNNLLAGISGSLEMLDKRLAEGRYGGLERYIEVAQSSTRRATSLTQRLLAFSRRQTLDPRPTDVNRMVAGMEDLIRRTVGPNVEVEVVGAGGLWLTRIDIPQLESALLNLVINARDAMPHGGRITIETANKWLDQRAASERELPPGQYVSLCVTDTGTGMTPEVISRAFDPFFTTKPIGQGTGLGLSMIHGFVRQSGGQVRIYSELGKGTTMCLYLPRHVGDLDTVDVVDDAPAGEAADGETVLVIDDEEAIRMLIAEVLQESGYRVLVAADGQSGLKILQSEQPIDLLITDVGLPGGLNGRQVADAARTVRPQLKVLFATGYAENSVFGNGHLDAGMQVITKPFSMAALSGRVREIIEG